MRLFSSKKKRPPSKKNLGTCERVGLKVRWWMSDQDTYKMIQAARNDVRFSEAFASIDHEAMLESDKMDREEYGDSLFEKCLPFKRLCDSGDYYLAVFKVRGKTQFDVLCFDYIDVEPPSLIEIYASRPVICREKDNEHVMYGEKDLLLKPTNLVCYTKLESEPDIFDVDGYLARVDRFKTEYENAS